MTSAGKYVQRTGDDTIQVLSLIGEDDKPPILGKDTRCELAEVLSDLEASPPEILLVSSQHGTWFCAGADVDELASVDNEDDAFDLSRSGQELLHRIASLPSLTAALVDGDALGGGLELALACDVLFMADDVEVRVGLPEVKLGIIPGFGGTQRLPRKVGLKRALKMILTGRKYTPLQAESYGLADRLLAPEGMERQAKQLLQDEPDAFETGQDKGIMDQLLEDTTPGRHFVFKNARSKTRKTSGEHYPAPFAAIDAIEEGIDQSIKEGLKIEARNVAELATKSSTRHLIDLYQHMKTLKDVSGEDLPDTKRTGVIGAGVMGGSIAQLFAYNQFPCRLKDVESGPLKDGMQRAQQIFQDGVDQGRWTSSFVNDRMEKISPTLSWEGFQQTDVLIEAVPEQLDVKQTVFQEMEQHTSDDTILATNTSSIRLQEIAEEMADPGRLVGLHFFNPVHKMQLVEVIEHEGTDPEVLQRAKHIVTELGKVPVRVGDGPGFLVNRLLFFYLQEAMILLEEGADVEQVDDVMTSFGMPQGPFEVMDQVGLDIAAHVADTLSSAFSDRAEPLSLLDEMLEKGWLGKKADCGFYRYENGDDQVNSDVYELLDRTDREPGEQEIQDRLLLALINEAVRALNAGIVQSPDELDTAMILGTGFAPFRGGPLSYADERGWGEIHQKLNDYQSTFGSRFEPAEGIPEREEASCDHPVGETRTSDVPVEDRGNNSGSAQPETAIVFSGGGARGAYEAGVLHGLCTHIFSDMEEPPNINVLVGTSSGAVNAYYLAGCLDRFSEGVNEMVEMWQGLSLEDHLVPTSAGSYSLLRWLMGNGGKQRMSLLDPSGIRNLIKEDFPWERIRPLIEEGYLHSLCITATQLATGRSVLFTDSILEELPPSPKGRNLDWILTQILPIHVFGSSSIPLFFPATRIDGTLYYDGGLRMDVPITPAISLGAEKVFVIGVKTPPPDRAPSHEISKQVHSDEEERPVEEYPGAPEMIGKILNALMLDPVERDRQRLFSLQDVLREGREKHGEEFSRKMADMLAPYTGGNLSNTSIHYHRPTRDFGELARNFVPDIADRLGGLRGQVFQRFANSDATGNWDLASYMLFDSEYTQELVEQGRDDVREHKASIKRFFEEE